MIVGFSRILISHLNIWLDDLFYSFYIISSVFRLTPELLRVHPFVSGNPADIVKEIVEFPSKGIYAVNATYR